MVAVKDTSSVVIQSLCAWPIVCPILLLSLSRTCMGKDASKYQLPGAWPATTNDCPTVAREVGREPETRAERGAVVPGVDVATGSILAGAGATITSQPNAAMTKKST